MKSESLIQREKCLHDIMRLDDCTDGAGHVHTLVKLWEEGALRINMG